MENNFWRVTKQYVAEIGPFVSIIIFLTLLDVSRDAVTGQFATQEELSVEQVQEDERTAHQKIVAESLRKKKALASSLIFFAGALMALILAQFSNRPLKIFIWGFLGLAIFSLLRIWLPRFYTDAAVFVLLLALIIFEIVKYFSKK